MENFRNKATYYFESINPLESGSSNVKGEADSSNKSHLDNIKQYSRILSENPEILLFGFRGRSGADYLQFQSESVEYDKLGTAHNGILATTTTYGLSGLILYFLFYLRPIFSYMKIYRLPDSSLRFIGLGAVFFLTLEFLPTLAFVPPFLTSMKGIFYFFLAIFFWRNAIYYSYQQKDNEERDQNIQEAHVDIPGNGPESRLRHVGRRIPPMKQ